MSGIESIDRVDKDIILATDRLLVSLLLVLALALRADIKNGIDNVMGILLSVLLA